MSFDSLYFLPFFLLSLAAFRALPWRGTVLLIFSIIFYIAAGWVDTVLFFIILAVNYAFSFMVARWRHSLWLALAVDVAFLGFFKYRNFLFSDGAVAGDFTSDIVIPLGISFYTFQLVAYLVDIRRGVTKLEPDPRKFVLFATFYPHLLAGPIMRANNLIPQLSRIFAGTGRRTLLVSWGLALMLLGATKKVLLADSLAPYVEDIFKHGPADAATAWFGCWVFGFQIYFDFSAYSDMAVGMAYLFGVHVPLNFRQPFLSTGPREFWQRWHITLSTWIRDYLYIPLGGNRGSKMRQMFLVVCVMGLAGLWHGANWTYPVWGLLWGVYIAMARLMPANVRIPPLLAWLPHMVMVNVLWAFFRAPDLGFSFRYLATMWGGPGMGSADYVSGGGQAVLMVLAGAALVLLQFAERRLYDRHVLVQLRRFDGPFLWAIMLGLITWLLLIPKSNINPFIYFRF